MIGFGVASRVVGRQIGGSRTLSLAIIGLRELFGYLASIQASAFRLPDTLLPSEPEQAELAIQQSSGLLVELGAQARVAGLRLSVHPGLHVALAAEQPDTAARSVAAVTAQALLLDALGCGPEAVIVLHVGGSGQVALERFAARYEQLPAPARRRVAVEAGQHGFDVTALLWLRRWYGVPLIFDALHFQLNNPGQLPLHDALALALGSWSPGVRPKIHLSTQRTEAHLRPGRGGDAPLIVAPQRGQHADFLNPFEVATLLRAARGLPGFDIMIEAKAADLALLRLREDVRLYAPDVAARLRV
ncbi:MAG: UV damage endonuclease UvsE [Roseiflexaceae bacterium]|nr:UV damage endonuclease UvsE [Roseiflexaceae bacterium]